MPYPHICGNNNPIDIKLGRGVYLNFLFFFLRFGSWTKLNSKDELSDEIFDSIISQWNCWMQQIIKQDKDIIAVKNQNIE